MQDGIIKGLGNSRWLKSGIGNTTTWQQFLDSLIAGTLPIDLSGINEEGWDVLGTPLNKQTLLTDVAAAMYGLGSDATVNDVFMALAIGVGKKGCLITVVYPDGSPAQGYTVQGATGPEGETLVTDASGNCLAVTTGDSLTLSIPNPAELDVEPVAAQQVTLEGTITTATLQLTLVTGTLTISSSVSKPVSKFCVSADFCGVGGGGAGSLPGYYYGSGGGGGYVTNAINVLIKSNSMVSVIVGAGGTVDNNATGSRSGGNGGITTVSIDGSNVLKANGGQGGQVIEHGAECIGGTGNGNGGDGVGGSNSATSGTGNIFNDASLGPAGGGGGGSATRSSTETTREPNGGSPNGASGAFENYNQQNVGFDSTDAGIGGGGGGAIQSSGQRPKYKASNGGPGIVYARFHREAA